MTQQQGFVNMKGGTAIIVPLCTGERLTIPVIEWSDVLAMCSIQNRSDLSSICGSITDYQRNKVSVVLDLSVNKYTSPLARYTGVRSVSHAKQQARYDIETNSNSSHQNIDLKSYLEILDRCPPDHDVLIVSGTPNNNHNKYYYFSR